MALAHIEGVCGGHSSQLAALAGRLLNIFTCGYTLEQAGNAGGGAGGRLPGNWQLAGTFINFGRRVLNFTQGLNANGICILCKPFASRRFAGRDETRRGREAPTRLAKMR